MFSQTLEKTGDALICRLAGIHNGMVPITRVVGPGGHVHPACSSWWFHLSTDHGCVQKVREGGDRVTWGRGLRTMGRLTLSNDLVQRGTGDFLHKCRGRAMTGAMSLSPQRMSNHTAHSCCWRLRSSPPHASGHTGKPRTLREILTIRLGSNHRKN